jgi:exodeoxyribonuclease V gamma subunit
MPEPSSGLLIFHGNRLDELANVMLTHVAQSPLPGLTPERWVVQGQGMKAWLEVQAAQHPQLGVLAATHIDQPAALLWDLQRLVLGAQAVPAELPLDETPLVWQLLRWLHQHRDDPNPVWQPLHHHLAAAPEALRAQREHQLALQLADVFDAYQTHRADWLALWAQGQAEVINGQGQRQALAPHQRWQALLWADLVQHAREVTGLRWVSRDQVFQAFVQRLAQAPAGSLHGLPPRLVWLGVSALPVSHIHALGLLSRHTQVLVFALNPSAAYWGDAQRRAHWPVSDLSAEPTASDHPLLAAWGQQARDFLHAIDDADPQSNPRRDFFQDPRPDAHTPTALQALQADVLLNRPPQGPSSEQPFPAPDGSLLFVNAHSPMREVQALHDQVLSWLAEDPSLQARDIVVMVSDLDTFEPLVRAAWGRFEPSDPRWVPHHMARPQPDQAQALQWVDKGLQLIQGPVTLPAAWSWLEHPAVMRAFGLSPEDLATLGDWLQDHGVRWGLSPEHAQAQGWPAELASDAAHTWSAGLRRLLLGHALGPALASPDQPALWQNAVAVAPPAGVSATALDGLVRWLDAVQHHVQEAQHDRTPREWAAWLNAWLTTCFTPVIEAHDATLNRLREALGHWVNACTLAGFEHALPLSVVHRHWLGQVRSAQQGATLIGSGVVFTTAMPLQSVPFRRVCLLGMRDGAFPRQRNPRDFDLMHAPGLARRGDRSRHDDDRYLLLQAVLSARDGLWVSWQGHQQQDGKPLPPSVLVTQWLDVLRLGHGQAWPVHHLPMHAHSLAYFSDTPEGWRTHAHEWHAAWQTALSTPASPVAPSPPVNTAASAPEGFEAADTQLSLAQLGGWLRHPIDAHARHALGVHWRSPDEAWPDAEPFALSPLASHRWVADAATSGQLPTHLLASGQLSPAALGQLQWEDLQRRSSQLHDALQALTSGWSPHEAALDVDLQLKPWRLTGRERGGQLWQAPDGLHATWVTASRLAFSVKGFTGGQSALPLPRLHLLAKVRLAQLAACAQGQAVHAHVLGPDLHIDWPPESPSAAQAQLQSWCDRYHQARQAPMPVVADWASLWVLQSQASGVDAQAAPTLANTWVRQQMQPNPRATFNDWQQHPLVQRFVANLDQALDTLSQEALPLYAPILKDLHLCTPAGQRQAWLPNHPAGLAP